MSGTKVSRRGFMAASAGLGVAFACPSIVRAASYATQPIRLFVGTGAAGTNDLVARLIAPVLKEELGQPVLVENRPGAATTLALGLVSKARPDGHTLLVSSGAAVAVHVTSVTKPADLIKDLSHVGMICDGAYTYALNAQVPAKDAKEFIELLKKEPGKIRYGGTGPGGTIHLSGELFCLRTGTKMTVVQYTNAGMRASDLLANETQLGIGGIGVLGQHIKSGALRGLFVAGEQREPLVPGPADVGRARNQGSGEHHELVWPARAERHARTDRAPAQCRLGESDRQYRSAQRPGRKRNVRFGRAARGARGAHEQGPQGAKRGRRGGEHPRRVM